MSSEYIDWDAFNEPFQEWTHRNFPDETVEQAALGLAEEVGELCRAVLKRSQGIRGTREEWDAEIRKELGDALMSLTWLANLTDNDLMNALEERWKVIRERDWVNNKKGHGMPDA